MTKEEKEKKIADRRLLTNVKTQIYNNIQEEAKPYILQYWKVIKEVWTLKNCHSKGEQEQLFSKYGLDNWEIYELNKKLKVKL